MSQPRCHVVQLAGINICPTVQLYILFRFTDFLDKKMCDTFKFGKGSLSDYAKVTFRPMIGSPALAQGIYR